MDVTDAELDFIAANAGADARMNDDEWAQLVVDSRRRNAERAAMADDDDDAWARDLAARIAEGSSK